MFTTPLSDSQVWLLPVATDYLLTWVAVAVVFIIELRQLRRVPRCSPNPTGSLARPMAFYWPVLVWGIQASINMRGSFSGCVTAKTPITSLLDLGMRASGAIVAGVLALAGVLVLVNVLQTIVLLWQAPLVRPQRGLPWPVVAAIASVFVYQLGLLFAFLSTLTERR